MGSWPFTPKHGVETDRVPDSAIHWTDSREFLVQSLIGWHSSTIIAVAAAITSISSPESISLLGAAILSAEEISREIAK